jgi:hypothetical protein
MHLAGHMKLILTTRFRSDHENAAAIQAQLVDMRNVGTHKSLKLTLHIAQEFALEAINAFGWPTMQDPVPVALAHLNPETVNEVMPDKRATPEPSNDTSPASGPDIPARAHKPVAADKRLAQQAGICCADRQFQLWLGINYKTSIQSEEEAAYFVRQYCKVNSRSEIKPGTEAGRLFDRLYSHFVIWRDADKYVEASA